MNQLKIRVQHEAYRIVWLQLAGVLLLALIALGWRGAMSGYSVLLGGLAYSIPNFIFVWRVFRYTGAQQMRKFVAAFGWGEMIKLFFSAILFLLIVKYLSISLSSVLFGFVGGIVSFWIACVMHFAKKTKPNSVT